MLKSLDLFILRAFSGPFIITFAVVIFILESQFLMRYIEDFMGRDIPTQDFLTLIFYFSLNVVPLAMPLGILVSSLITFGNLGEHRELTAIKASGVSLTRILRPIFIVVLFMAIGLFFFSNNVVPWANLQGYSLLYDLRNKKPALDFKDGLFYDGLEGFEIRVGKKVEETDELKDVLIYDHTADRGNTKVTLAESGRMYTILEDRYLVLELEKGNHFNQVLDNRKPKHIEYVRSSFEKNKIVFSLASFDMSRTDIDLFKGNKVMKKINELHSERDSMMIELDDLVERLPKMLSSYSLYMHKFPTGKDGKLLIFPKDKTLFAQKRVEYAYRDKQNEVLKMALTQSRNSAAMMRAMEERILGIHKTYNEFGVEFQRKFAMPITCLILFLIGAPIGAIIKKGGLGIPLLVAIVFFILYYVLNMMGERWSKEDILHPVLGMWMANTILFFPALYFTYQAWKDANFFSFSINVVDWLKALVFKKASPMPNNGGVASGE